MQHSVNRNTKKASEDKALQPVLFGLTPFGCALALALALWATFFLCIAAFNFGVINGETAAILRAETNR